VIGHAILTSGSGQVWLVFKNIASKSTFVVCRWSWKKSLANLSLFDNSFAHFVGKIFFYLSFLKK